jgi:hypothetical protein
VGLGNAGGLKKKLLRSFLRFFAYLLHFLRKNPIGNAHILDVQTFLSDPEVANFYRRTRNGKKVFLKKDPEFLRWRLSRPNAEYFCFTFGEKSINACAVVRVLEMNGYKTAAIVDLDAESDFHGRAITENIINFARGKRVDLIGVCMNQSLFKKLGLKKLGFFQSFSKFKVITRKTGEHNITFDEMNSQITWLDSDTV